MRVADIEIIHLRQSDVDTPQASVWRDETALIVVRTDEGLVGVGEAVANPAAIKALLDTRQVNPWDSGVKDLLLGADPSEPEAVIERLRGVHTFLSGRVGLGHVAFAGVEIAIWDLAGQIRGCPVWQLLTDAPAHKVTPYITMFTHSGDYEGVLARTVDDIDQVRAMGFTAAKLELLGYNMPDESEIPPICEAIRQHVGREYRLLADVGYRWRTFDDAVDCVSRLGSADLFFLEAPLWPDDLLGYRRLREATDTPIGGCEVLTSFAEYIPFLELGCLDVVQGAAHRLGIADLHRLGREARQRGLPLVPFCYTATTVGYMAGLHVATANVNTPLLEYQLPQIDPGGLLRSQIAGPEPRVLDGIFETPTRPGLGVEIDWAAVEHYRVDR